MHDTADAEASDDLRIGRLPRAMLAWLVLSTVVAKTIWERNGPSQTDSILVVALVSGLIALAVHSLRVRFGSEPKTWSPRLFTTAMAVAWLLFLAGTIWRVAPDTQRVEISSALFGPLPLGYRYVPEDRQLIVQRVPGCERPPGLAYVSRRVMYGKTFAARVMLYGAVGGAHLPYVATLLERGLGVRLQRVEATGYKLLATKLKNGAWLYLGQRGPTVVAVEVSTPEAWRPMGDRLFDQTRTAVGV